jgi:hypothetical protein
MDENADENGPKQTEEIVDEDQKQEDESEDQKQEDGVEEQEHSNEKRYETSEKCIEKAMKKNRKARKIIKMFETFCELAEDVTITEKRYYEKDNDITYFFEVKKKFATYVVFELSKKCPHLTMHSNLTISMKRIDTMKKNGNYLRFADEVFKLMATIGMDHNAFKRSSEEYVSFKMEKDIFYEDVTYKEILNAVISIDSLARWFYLKVGILTGAYNSDADASLEKDFLKGNLYL